MSRAATDLLERLRGFSSREDGGSVETTGFIEFEGARQLFVMAIPKGHVRPWGLVVCPSLFEFSRFQPTEISLLRRAARLGFPGIYVEPSGMGDSEGELEHSTVEARVNTASAAFKNLDDHVSDLDLRPCWFGARLGGAIALRAAASTPGAVVAWDPVIDGRQYWAQARKLARITAVSQKQRSFRDPDKLLEEQDHASLLWLRVTRALRSDLFDAVSEMASVHVEGPTLIVAVNESTIAPVMERFGAGNSDIESVSLARDGVDHLGVAEASEAIVPTIDWMSRKLS